MKNQIVLAWLLYATFLTFPSVVNGQADPANSKSTQQTQAKSQRVRNVSLRAVPDLLQTLKSANFAGGGSQFCAPVAVSNSLVWLEEKAQDQDYQIELVKKLSSKEYMNTNTTNGTGTNELMRGVKRYANEIWGSYDRLEYAGWRSCLKGSRVASKPTIEWIVEGLHEKSAVWINVGWYKREVDEENLNFERVGGHWLTIVGHSNGKLIFHDPAPRGGLKPKRERVRYEIIDAGTQTGKKRGLPVDAKGSIQLTQGMRMSTKGDTAIIDGAVIFELEAPKELFREWTSLNGKFSVVAKLLRADGGVVELQTEEGNEPIVIKIKKLSKNDRKYIESRPASETETSGEK